MNQNTHAELVNAIGRMLDLELFLESAADYYKCEQDWEMVTAEMQGEYDPQLTYIAWSECLQMLRLFAKAGIQPNDGQQLKDVLREHGWLGVRTIRLR